MCSSCKDGHSFLSQLSIMIFRFLSSCHVAPVFWLQVARSLDFVPPQSLLSPHVSTGMWIPSASLSLLGTRTPMSSSPPHHIPLGLWDTSSLVTLYCNSMFSFFPPTFLALGDFFPLISSLFLSSLLAAWGKSFYLFRFGSSVVTGMAVFHPSHRQCKASHFPSTKPTLGFYRYPWQSCKIRPLTLGVSFSTPHQSLLLLFLCKPSEVGKLWPHQADGLVFCFFSHS